MNRIEYESYLFTDETITNGKVYLSNSMAFDALDVDTLNIEVISDDIGNRLVYTNERYVYSTVNGEAYVIFGNNIRNYKYGDPIYYYHNEMLVGKFYIRNIVRLNKNLFSINAVSAVGLWNEITYLGGIYNGITVRDLVNEILPNFSIEIADNVASIPLYGWIGVESVTDSICEILFATGASLIKDSEGNPKIAFLENLPIIDVADDHVYIGGSVDYKSPATTVNVTEHAFYESVNDKVVTLFDNTDGSGSVENKLITFSKPCYDLEWDGEPVPAAWNNGANYCYVTGTGVLTGKEYTHTTKVFTANVDTQSEPKEVWIKNATLVSATNSANVAARVIDYRSRAEEVSFEIVVDDERVKPGTKIAFTDPYGEDTVGMVADMDITISGILKSKSKIVKNYTPGHFGNNFENVMLFTENSTWTPPAGVEFVRFVIGQGGQAGQNGYQGKSAYTYGGTFSDDNVAAGDGGAGGEAGGAGKVIVVDISTIAPTYTISIGAGGQPGEGSGALGNEGTHSTVVGNGVTYSSNDGAVPPEGFREIIEGVTYATAGRDGIAGAKGGETGGLGVGKAGQSLTYEEQTYAGGAGSTVVINDTNHKSGGGSGGGAAYNGAGADGQPAVYNSLGNAVGGQGGRGGNAGQIPYTPTLSGGGQGGCGGGGGGCPSVHRNRRSSSQDWGGYNWGTVGAGGSFSLGGVGGNGFVLVYY